MERCQLKNTARINKIDLYSSFRFAVLLLLFFSAAIQVKAECELPAVKVRFANPRFDCPTHRYCLDVEFMADTPNAQLFGMNLRFFYDDKVLEFLAMGDFAEGYASLHAPQILKNNPASGELFGFSGTPAWFNGTVQLVSPTSVYISTTGWTKLFSICFLVEGPVELGVTDFCPSIVWDLKSVPGAGGFQDGNDGVVITVVDVSDRQESAPSDEKVVQFNWTYDDTGSQFGYPQSADCLTEICGYVIPISNWAIYLAFGLMLVFSFILIKRRIT